MSLAHAALGSAPAPPARGALTLGLMPKVLLVFVPVFLLLTLLCVRVLLDYGRGEQRDALAARLGALSGRVAIAIGAATHGPPPADAKLLRSLLATLSGEPAFLCAEVLQPDGARLAAWPAIGCDALAGPASDTRQPIRGGAVPAVLRLRFTDTPLRAEAARRGLLLAVGDSASFLVALLALWLGHRLWLGPPVARLLASIRAGAATGTRRPVAWRSGDELGQIVAAYNDFIAREEARDAELRGLNQELEARVRERTLALLTSEARLRSIIDTVTEGIVTADARGVIRSVNRAAEAMFGTANALVGRKVAALLADADAADGLLAERPSARMQGRRADGGAFAMDVQVAAIEDVDGVLFTLCARDVTPQAAHEDGLKRARDAAERADRAKSDFLAVITHELRTPLNGVIGMTGLLLDGDLNAQSRHYAETLREAGEHLLQLINDVLDFTKLEANRLTYEDILFEPEGVLHSALELLQPRAAARGLRLETAIDASVPAQARGDPGRLRQVLMNLVGNAVKFTERGFVRVALSARPAETGWLMLHVAVSDSGIGIAPEHLPRLFQEFSQIDSSISRRFGGTGLGLAICRKLVSGMGGEITAESVAGQGSTFRFAVRVRDAGGAPPPPPPSAGEAQAPRGRALRVLVAEDNQTNQVVIRAMLGKLGHRADLVGNGMEVVAAVRERPYDVVLMDVMMPELDGLEATRRIRALGGALASIPIFGLTAHAAAAEHAACRAAGMDRVITKPVTIGALAEPIGEIVAGLPPS
jgi:PAS domain S-box-containing protein